MPLNDGAINEILLFAPDGTEVSGDLMTLADYGSSPDRLRGHQAGLAKRALENRVLRQATLMAAGLAQFVANRHVAGVRDNADVDAIEEGLVATIAAMISAALAGFVVPDSGIGKHTVAIPAAGMDPTISNGCGYYSRVEVAAGQPEVAYLPFDAAVEESAEFRIPVPKSWDGGAITAKAIWSRGAVATQFGAAWGFKAAFMGNDDGHALAFGDEVVVVGDGTTNNDLYVTAESAAITPSGTPADDGLLIVRVSRKVADAGDTLDVDARLEAVQILWTTNAATDA